MTDIEIKTIQLLENSSTNFVRDNGHFTCIPCAGKSTDERSFITFVIDTKSQYRQDLSSSVDIGFVKKKGKQYICFKDSYKLLFDKANIVYPKILSDHSIRFFPDSFSALLTNDKFPQIVEKMILDAFNYNSFDCCSRYVECSDRKKCVHPDLFYATASCQYKKHVDKGEFFYGINKNIK